MHSPTPIGDSHLVYFRPELNYVALAGLKLLAILLPRPECCDYRLTHMTYLLSLFSLTFLVRL